MFNSDLRLLAEAYDGMIKKNKEGSSLIDKELEKAAFSDQDQEENVDQDGKDKTKKDPYVLKENGGEEFGIALEAVKALDAEQLEVFFNSLASYFEQTADMIGNMDVAALVQHLKGAASVVQARTGN
jgi:hypothetical protein